MLLLAMFGRSTRTTDPSWDATDSHQTANRYLVSRCSKYTPEALTQRVIGDEHSPNMWRIMGTAMMNSRGFKQAYNCPIKEPTCEIW